MVIRPSWDLEYGERIQLQWAELHCCWFQRGFKRLYSFRVTSTSCVCVFVDFLSAFTPSYYTLLLLWSSKCHPPLSVSWFCHFLSFTLHLRWVITLSVPSHHVASLAFILHLLPPKTLFHLPPSPLLHFLFLFIIPLAILLPSACICPLQDFWCGFQWAELVVREKEGGEECQSRGRGREAEWRGFIGETHVPDETLRGKFGGLCPSSPDVKHVSDAHYPWMSRVFFLSLSFSHCLTHTHIWTNICVTTALVDFLTPILPESSGKNSTRCSVQAMQHERSAFPKVCISSSLHEDCKEITEQHSVCTHFISL